MKSVLEYAISRPVPGNAPARNKESFRQCFQSSLASCLRRGFSVEECFGVVWEETLEEVELSEEEQGVLYEQLIRWAKNI